MNRYIESLNLALLWLSDNGTESSAAQKLGVSRATIWGWRDRGVVPPDKAVLIEKASGGVIRRDQLNPVFHE